MTGVRAGGTREMIRKHISMKSPAVCMRKHSASLSTNLSLSLSPLVALISDRCGERRKAWPRVRERAGRQAEGIAVGAVCALVPRE